MHYSAKRGIAIARRLSVRLSEKTLVDHDHISWKSWKLSARPISPTPSLFVSKGHLPTLLYVKHVEILGRLEVGWGKVVCWSTKAAISLKRVELEENLL